MPVYELLVRTKDKVSPDPVKNAGLTKRGDVIALKPAETAWWTKAEQENPEWAIIKAELTEQMAESLLAPEMPPDLAKDYVMLRKRAICLDLDSLGVALDKGEVRDDPKVEFVKETVLSVVVVKEKLPEPDELK